MQTANVMVAIDPNRFNTVPKYRVTAAEIALLRALHGADGVFNVEQTDDVDVSNREELRRLREQYTSPSAKDALDRLYPGAAARVFETLDELDLDDALFKNGERQKPEPKRSRKKADDTPADSADDKLFE